MIRVWFTAALLAACVTGRAFAQAEVSLSDPLSVPDRVEPPADDTGAPFTLSISAENDSRGLKPNNATDRYYTNGLKVTLSHEPEWADRLNEALPFKAPVDYTRTHAGYVFGQNIYTPNDTDRSIPDRSDRPYAAWLYAGVFWERIAAREMDHYELNIGVVGPSALGEQTQNGFHNFEHAAEANGWAYQLHDEPAFDLIYYRKWKFPLLRGGESAWAPWLQSDLIPRAGLTAGSVHVHADLGATWRVGFNLPDDFGPTRLGEFSPPPRSASRRVGAFGYVRVNGRAVAHNMLIEGNNFEDSRGVTIRPLVGELEAGLSLQYRRLTLTYAQTFQTQEFYGQDGAHSLGAVTLSWSCHF